MVEEEVFNLSLFSNTEQRDQMPMSHQHERLQQAETVKDFAVIHDSLVKDVLEYEALLLI